MTTPALLRREIRALAFDQYRTVIDMQNGPTDAVTPSGVEGSARQFVTWARVAHFENLMIDALCADGTRPILELGSGARWQDVVMSERSGRSTTRRTTCTMTHHDRTSGSRPVAYACVDAVALQGGRPPLPVGTASSTAASAPWAFSVRVASAETAPDCRQEPSLAALERRAGCWVGRPARTALAPSGALAMLRWASSSMGSPSRQAAVTGLATC